MIVSALVTGGIFPGDQELIVSHAHHVARAELPPAPVLRLAVHEHGLGRQQILRLAAAPHESRELEQLPQPDLFGRDADFRRQGRAIYAARVRLAPMPSKARVLVLAIDAADPGLVRELAYAGEMPAMARFLERAAVVETRAPVGVFVSANWPTIFTSNPPDRHRYLCWNEYIGGTYDYRETDPTMVRGTPFWEALSEAGKRVAV